MSQTAVESLRGVGAKRAEQLRKVGIETTADLISYLPRSYEDYSNVQTVAGARHGAHAACLVRIADEPKFLRVRGMTILSVRAQDDTGIVFLKWFNQPYRRGQLQVGAQIYACGRIDRSKGISLVNPRLSATLPGLIPVYPLARGLTQRTVREVVKAALCAQLSMYDPFGVEFSERYGLMALMPAYREAHLPSGREALAAARRRLAFQNMLYYLLAVRHNRQERSRSLGYAYRTEGMEAPFLASLGFALTGAQRRVMREFETDMALPMPMNRLLQGDVGSGKTALAMYALYIAALNGRQGAFLVPSEILARQHMQSLAALFGDQACILIGGMPKKERQRALARIESGEARVVVGTHALFEDDVRFCALGLIVTDEQHRFGVVQRARMEQKAVRPDVLVMSATPIPRTLSLLLYGDLDVSVLDELPPGRKPVKTSYIRAEKRDDMYRYIAKCAENGVQSYIVCPFIDADEAAESRSAERVYADMTERFPSLPVELLHGRMSGRKREPVMERFRSGQTRVLVTTTVIEVGVHVAQAGVMVIESADRFGLATLHQLRGRVGRSAEQAYCFLLADGASEASLARIGAMLSTNDGFEIAERDLALRGPGDFLGTRQHGEADAALISAAGDMETLELAKRAADEIMALPNAQSNEILDDAMRRYARSMEHIAMN